jgi:hypothetical protein
MCFAGADQPIVPENDPRDLFDRLFATLSQSQVELDRVRQRRASIIDLVTGELEAAAKRYGAEDRLKVEAHLDALRAIEQRLESLVDCGDVAAPPGNLDPGNNDAFPDVVDLHSDLIVRALACDLTRVASMQWSYSGGAGVRFNWLGVSGTYHSQVIHEPGTDADVAKVNTWFSEQFATLLDRLAAVPEGNGTMLDNTLVVWGRDMAVGAGHGLEPLPVILAGRAGGRLATGRYLQFPAQDHQRLLVSVAQAVGLDDVTSFGTLDTGSGPLPGLLA